MRIILGQAFYMYTHVYIVCVPGATGKSMHAVLQQLIADDPIAKENPALFDLDVYISWLLNETGYDHWDLHANSGKK